MGELFSGSRGFQGFCFVLHGFAICFSRSCGKRNIIPDRNRPELTFLCQQQEVKKKERGQMVHD